MFGVYFCGCLVGWFGWFYLFVDVNLVLFWWLFMLFGHDDFGCLFCVVLTGLGWFALFVIAGWFVKIVLFGLMDCGFWRFVLLV